MSGPCVREFMARWLGRLPGPFQAVDTEAGYGWELSFRQVEFSDTAVFDRPRDGRAWFDAAIRENLDVGRPEKVALVFDRRVTSRTPGALRTKVITPGVDPHIQIHYRSSKTKAYFKDLHGVRVATINNPADFGVKKTVNAANFDELRHIGRATNARFLEAVGEHAPAPPDTAALEQVVMPSVHDGLKAPGLALRRAPGAGAVGFDRRLLPRHRGAHQPRPRGHDALSPRSRLLHPPGHLRPAPTQTQGLHRTCVPHRNHY